MGETERNELWGDAHLIQGFNCWFDTNGLIFHLRSLSFVWLWTRLFCSWGVSYDEMPISSIALIVDLTLMVLNRSSTLGASHLFGYRRGIAESPCRSLHSMVQILKKFSGENFDFFLILTVKNTIRQLRSLEPHFCNPKLNYIQALGYCPTAGIFDFLT